MTYSQEVIDWAKQVAAATQLPLGDPLVVAGLHHLLDCTREDAPRYIAPFYLKPLAIRELDEGKLRLYADVAFVREYECALAKVDAGRSSGWAARRWAVIASFFPRFPGIACPEDKYA